MTSGLLRPDYQYGSAKVNADGTVAALAGGIAAVSKTGTGVYVVALNAPAASTEHVFTTQRLASDTDRVTLNVYQDSDTQLTIRATSSIVAGPIDTAFYLVGRRVR